MANNHSAEFLRGAKWWADQHTTGYKQLCALLAAAEAREAFPIPDTLPEVPEAREAGERDYLGEARQAAIELANKLAQQKIAAAEVIAELHGCLDTIKHLSAEIGADSGDIAVHGVALLGLAKIDHWKEANGGK